MIKINNLRTEYLENPMGLGVKTPRLGWKLHSDKFNVVQVAYEIQASTNIQFTQLVWESGKINSQSQLINYNGSELKSMMRIYWRVKVWSNYEESEFSLPAYFETGLYDTSEWIAKWIEPENEIDLDAYKPAPYLRKEFNVKKGLVFARAFMTARGIYRFYINGYDGTDDLFTPGFTSYYKRLQYQEYDITDFLYEGKNVLGIILGDGWWRGSNGALSLKNNFGYKVAFLGQLVLTYDDGSQEIIGSDESFKTSYGPILKSDLKSGEVYDARKECTGWNKPNFNDSTWKNVNITEDRLDNLISTSSVPVKRKERFAPIILKTPNGQTVLDFGQNISGYVEMKVQGPKGTEVVLIHGETLDKNGNFTLKNLEFFGEQNDFQEVHYILKGDNEESYEPYFTIFGFRYVLIKNYPGDIRKENFNAVAIYSVMEQTGTFTCSNPLIDKLVLNTIWSQKGNFVDVPTDCPTRERAGWTGDAQIFCRAASDLMNVYSFYEKWMADVASEQNATGSVGGAVPNVLSYQNADEMDRIFKAGHSPLFDMFLTRKPGESGMFDGSAGWGDAAVIIPWTMYLCYGDKKILEQQFHSAKAWVDYMDTCAKSANENYKDTPAYRTYTDGELDANYIWDTRFHYGEWLEADASDNDLGGGMKEFFIKQLTFSDPLVATAYYAYSTRLLSEIAEIIGKKEEGRKYFRLYQKVKRVYNKYFIQEDGSILDDRQAPNIRTLAFDLADEDKKQLVADRLAVMVKQNDYHLNTGFLSTPFILQVLADYGYTDIAYRLLEQETIPSWLYAVKKGATTIWESWRGITPEGEASGSLNHYSYGAVCNFLFAGVAGIRPNIEIPGYKHFTIKPIIGGTLTKALARYESIYGTIESSWEKTKDGIVYNFTIPVNTTATVMLPGSNNGVEKITEKLSNVHLEGDRIVFDVGSGYYQLKI